MEHFALFYRITAAFPGTPKWLWRAKAKAVK
jgi:hypothetical protein